MFRQTPQNSNFRSLQTVKIETFPGAAPLDPPEGLTAPQTPSYLATALREQWRPDGGGGGGGGIILGSQNGKRSPKSQKATKKSH